MSQHDCACCCVTPHVFTEEGQQIFLAVRTESARMIAYSGAFTVSQLHQRLHMLESCFTLAALDRLVELEELRLVHNAHFTHHRVYVEGDEGLPKVKP